MDQTVTISCNNTKYQFEIEDILPNLLKESFDLCDKPTTLFSTNNNQVVPSTKWQTKLIAGASYYIKNPKAEEKEEKEGLGEIILNSLVASTAVYHMSHTEDDVEKCRQYLIEQLDNHYFESVIQSKYGENVYLIAKEIDAERIYIAFRGTKELADWKKNIQANLVQSDYSLILGKLHSGFLQRAQLFPYEKILHHEMFKGKDVVVCGHSLGGAIASIVAIRLQTERARLKYDGKINCITFGAPLFGDKVLQKSFDHKNMHHFLCNNDPVPYLLNYTQTASSLISKLNLQIASFSQQISTNKGSSYLMKSTKERLDKKVNFEKIIEGVVSGAGIIADIAAHVYPASRAVSNAKAVFDVFNDVKQAHITCDSVFTPIGNFYFLDKQSKKLKFFDWKSYNDTARYTEQYFNEFSDKIIPNAHNLTYYNELFREHAKHFGIAFQSYPSHVETVIPGGDYIVSELREVFFLNPFKPIVHSVEMIKVDNRDNTFLRLTFTGENLYNLVLSSCLLSFNVPFAVNEEKTVIKKVPVGEKMQRVIVEEPFDEDIVVPDVGTPLSFATQFGSCEKTIMPQNIRGLVNRSVAQIARHDSVSLIVRNAMQRGMALSKLMEDFGDGSSNLLLEEIKQLGKTVLDPTCMKDVLLTLKDSKYDFKFILSNEEAFAKFKNFSIEIEKYIRSPIEIEAEWSVLQKVIFSASMGIGAAAFGYLAGPGLAIMGFILTPTVSTSAISVGCMTGAGAFGYGALNLMSNSLTDSAYENALKWINQQLFEARRTRLDEETSVKIRDLQDDGTVCSNEKILMMLTDTKYGELFPDTSYFNKVATKSKLAIKKRIDVIKRVHKIREIFSQQCFLGIVGLQDAGKTTLLQKIWGIGGKTGLFSHTDTPLLYDVTSKFYVVDYPGSNSLDYHSKTFSICGAMNNMVIVVLPFTGDISSLLSDEICNIFHVMRGSESTRVLLCINKCGMYLDQLRDELKDKTSPIDFIRNRYIDKLNEYYEKNERGITIRNEDVLFTDWMIGEEKHARDFGICGPSEVKRQIQNYLISYGIYKENESDFEKCFYSLNEQ